MKIRDLPPTQVPELTARQRELYDAVFTHGSILGAAKAHGIKQNQVRAAVEKAEGLGMPKAPRGLPGGRHRPQPTPASPGAKRTEGEMPGIRVPKGSERDPQTGLLRPIGTKVDGGKLEPFVTPPGDLERRQATDEERAGFQAAAWTKTPGDTVERIRAARKTPREYLGLDPTPDPVAGRILEALDAAPVGSEDEDGHVHVAIAIPVNELVADPTPAAADQGDETPTEQPASPPGEASVAEETSSGAGAIPAASNGHATEPASIPPGLRDLRAYAAREAERLADELGRIRDELEQARTVIAWLDRRIEAGR